MWCAKNAGQESHAHQREQDQSKDKTHGDARKAAIRPAPKLSQQNVHTTNTKGVELRITPTTSIPTKGSKISPLSDPSAQSLLAPTSTESTEGSRLTITRSQTIPNDQKLSVDQIIAQALKQAHQLKETHDVFHSSPETSDETQKTKEGNFTSSPVKSSPASDEPISSLNFTSSSDNKTSPYSAEGGQTAGAQLNQTHDVVHSSPETSDETQKTKVGDLTSSPVKSSPSSDVPIPSLNFTRSTKNKISPVSAEGGQTAGAQTSSLCSSERIVDSMVTEALQYAQAAQNANDEEHFNHSAPTTGNDFSFHSNSEGGEDEGGMDVDSYYSQHDDSRSLDDSPWYAC